MSVQKWFPRLVLGVMLLALALPTSLLAQGTGRVLLTLTQVDNSTFPEVAAFVTVTDPAGAPIKGLDKSQFEAFEDGRSVPISEVSTVDQSQLGIAVALVMDASGSMKGKALDDAKAAAIEFIKQLTDRDEGVVYSFANDVQLRQDFTKDRNALINAVNGLEAAGPTALHEALFRAAKALATRPPGRKVVILFTDGEQDPPNPSWTLDDGIGEANSGGIPVYTAGLVTKDYKAAPLQKIAEKTNGRYFQAESSDQLKDLYKSIAEQLKSQYIVKYISDLPADLKSHSLLIKVKAPQGEADGIKSFAALPGPIPYPRLPLKEGEKVKQELRTITPDIIAQGTVTKVEYYVDDVLKSTTTTPPFSFFWNVGELKAGAHTLTVKAFDNATPPNVGTRRVGVEVLPRVWPPPWLMPAIVGGGVLLLGLILVAALLLTRRPRPVSPMPTYPYGVPPEVPTTPGVPTPIVPAPGPGPTIPPTVPTPGPFPAVEGAPSPAKTEILRKPPAAIAYLIMTKGERVGKEFHLKADGDTSIGRDAATNDIVVSDSAVSRQHAKVRLEGDTFYIYDLGTTNHTFVNGQQIQRQALQNGDVVLIGETSFVFKRV